MAVLSKIRERSLVLILIIGMALFAFVASPKKIMSLFQSHKQGLVGNINGESISREEYTAQVKSIKAQNPNLKDSQATDQVWDAIMSDKIYSSQLEKAGVVVGENDIWEAIINEPSIKNSKQFQNELGMFDPELLRSYIADLRENKDDDQGRQLAAWVAYENSVKQNLERKTYLNLIHAGMGVSSEEGKQYYITNNTKVSGKYVMLPYASIADSTISVSDTDIKNYINAHKKQFQVKASRDIQYVKFDLKPTDADKEMIRKDLASLVPGLKTATGEDQIELVDSNSDIPLEDVFVDKKALNTKVADTLFNMNIGDVYGPYEDKGYYKITKLIESKEINTVAASHILVSFKGAQNAKPEITRTKEEAEAQAKLILKKVSKAGVDFAEEAKVSSDGPSGPRGGSLGTFAEGRMVPKFNDWVFSHKKGDIGMVETEFGFHIIHMDDTFPGKKFLTIAKVIEPSRETESRVFTEAQSFAADIAKGSDFTALAKEKKYSIQNAQKLAKRGDAVPGLQGNNFQIIAWTFEEDAELGDTKRFDLDKEGYVVAQITQMESEGLQSVKGATAKVRPLVIKDKKAALLIKKLDGTLAEIAKKEGVRVNNTGDLTFSKPPTAALGKDKAVVGALLSMKEGETLRGVRGQTGVYALALTKKEAPVELSSYEPYRQQLQNKIKKDDAKIYQALKATMTVEDYR